MNRALNIKNWDAGGNCYVLKGNPKNKWVGYQVSVIENLISKFGEDFNIVIWCDPKEENDYYCIPFKAIKHLFSEQNKTTGKYPDRWTTIILNDRLMMHSNASLSVDISTYYSQPLIPKEILIIDEDYFIENAKAQISIRIGQSKFRNGVLKNFNYKCCISGISEQQLLTASHIIPWADKKEFRADIANGLCLYIEYDAFFDKGYIAFSDDLEIITTSKTSKFSPSLKEKLLVLDGKKLNMPEIKPINVTYLKYHRDNIFKG